MIRMTTELELALKLSILQENIDQWIKLVRKEIDMLRKEVIMLREFSDQDYGDISTLDERLQTLEDTIFLNEISRKRGIL